VSVLDLATLRCVLDSTAATVRDRAEQVDREAVFPTANLGLLRESGLLGLLVPKKYGGPGGSLANAVETSHVLGGACLTTALIWAMHTQQVDTLVRFGSDELKDKVLPDIAEGETYVASMTTETSKGGYLLSAESAVSEQPNGFQLVRECPIVTGGEHADGFLVTARASEDAPASAVSLVYLEGGSVTVEARDRWAPMGMRGTQSVGIRLSGPVDSSQIVGDTGKFRDVALDSMIPVTHLVWAASWLGAAHQCLADVVRLARSTGRPRGLDIRSDLTRFRLGQIRVELEIVSAYLASTLQEVIKSREAGRSLDRRPLQIQLNSLKVIAAERSFSAVDQLIELCGLGVGYLGSGLPNLERAFRDLRSASLNYSNERLLKSIGAFTALDRGQELLGTASWQSMQCSGEVVRPSVDE
jgi:acyl-CoA dehydrogenase